MCESLCRPTQYIVRGTFRFHSRLCSASVICQWTLRSGKPPSPSFRHRSKGGATRAADSASAMPRPKVKPQDRQRSVKACDACKASKKRCDARQPCRLCLKKGTPDTCNYTPTSRDRRRRHSQSDISQTNSIAVAAGDFPTGGSIIALPSQRPSVQLSSQPPALLVQHPQVQAVEDDAESETDYVPDSRNSVERTTEQRPALLYNSSGDKGISSSRC